MFNEDLHSLILIFTGCMSAGRFSDVGAHLFIAEIEITCCGLIKIKIQFIFMNQAEKECSSITSLLDQFTLGICVLIINASLTLPSNFPFLHQFIHLSTFASTLVLNTDLYE